MSCEYKTYWETGDGLACRFDVGGSKLMVEVAGFAVSRWWSDWEPRDLCQSEVWKFAKWIEQNRGGFEHNSTLEIDSKGAARLWNSERTESELLDLASLLPAR